MVNIRQLWSGTDQVEHSPDTEGHGSDSSRIDALLDAFRQDARMNMSTGGASRRTGGAWRGPDANLGVLRVGDKVRVRVRVSVCERDRACVCVCVCVRERERERECVCECI